MASLKFRVDREVVNEHGQVMGYTKWMGGPSLARITNAVCPDGRRRTAYITGEPDTFFTQPARVNVGKHSIKGYITVEDGLFSFTQEAV